jgi:hypothetical protein
MGTRSNLAVACFSGALVFACALAACGSRTGLFVEQDEVFDAGADQGHLSPDQFVPDQFVPDEPDAMEEDAFDALPTIDSNRPDVPVFNPCPDADATLIYVIGEHNTLYSYDPPTATFTTIGTISCPSPAGTEPFSMAVDREGIAYVEFNDAHLYRVSTKTTSCTQTRYDPSSNGGTTFGMGFVANAGDAGETLFVAGTLSSVLATIDTTTFAFNVVGPFAPPEAELTGTGDGRLFAFYASGNHSDIGQIDPTTAKVSAADTLALSQGQGWAFGFWGGAFYTFTAPAGGTVVTRFDPLDQSLVQEAMIDDIIVGAGVSTCAPSQ